MKGEREGGELERVGGKRERRETKRKQFFLDPKLHPTKAMHFLLPMSNISSSGGFSSSSQLSALFSPSSLRGSGCLVSGT